MALPAGTVWSCSSTSCDDIPCDVWGGRLEAQELLNGIGDECVILDQLATLIRMFCKYLPHPTNEAIRGLVAGA